MFLLLEPSDQPFRFFQCDFYCWYPLCLAGCQEQPIVNTVCIQFEYITKVRYFTNRLKAQSTYHFSYTNKRTNLHPWHQLISLEKPSIEVIVGITYRGISKTVSNGRAFATRLPIYTVSLRLLAPFPCLVAIMAQLS